MLTFQNVPNIGNLGDIYWNELNNMITAVFKDVDEDFSKYSDKSNVSQLIKERCTETLKVSTEIGNYIKSLHKSLILPEKESNRNPSNFSYSILV